MRTAAIMVLGVTIGGGLLLSGCWPHPSAHELFEWTHHNYTVAVDPGEPRVSGETKDEDRAEVEPSQPARMARSQDVEPAQIEAIFEANADVLIDCIRTRVLGEQVPQHHVPQHGARGDVD